MLLLGLHNTVDDTDVFVVTICLDDDMTNSEVTTEFSNPSQRIIKCNCTLHHYIRRKIALLCLFVYFFWLHMGSVFQFL